ncbi:MAG: methyltransferase [Bacteroidales bacterium]|nr:methyltransferase [Bacteroidales bacterium]
MSNPFFEFKRFTVRHDACAMKVGTDGCVLGTWTHIPREATVLDVGTGTGLIALMLAQRGAQSVTCIDIDEDAVKQARLNVALSPWSDIIEVGQADFNHFIPSRLFDVVVCNPPFFEHSLKCPDSRRTIARHADTLTPKALVEGAYACLKPEGSLSVIIPADQRTNYVATAIGTGFVLARETQLTTTLGRAPKRLLMEFSRHSPSLGCATDQLVIEQAPGVYSDAFRTLLHEFYLHF